METASAGSSANDGQAMQSELGELQGLRLEQLRDELCGLSSVLLAVRDAALWQRIHKKCYQFSTPKCP